MKKPDTSLPKSPASATAGPLKAWFEEHASDEPAYWFRVPDDIEWLLAQKPAVIKVYLTILHNTQRDRNPGWLSDRKLAEKARLGSVRHATEARKILIAAGKVEVLSRPGSHAKYRLTHGWKGKELCPPRDTVCKDDFTNCPPVGVQLESPKEAAEKGNCTPVGTHNCTPVGTQHLESLESSSAFRKTSAVLPGAFPADDDQNPKLPRTGSETPEQEFRLRFAERHPGRTDCDEILCHVVKVELDKTGTPFAEFLEFDEEKTTSPSKVTNPGGHYRKLARDVAKRYTANRKQQTIEQGLTIRRMAEATATAVAPDPSKRCEKCSGGGFLSLQPPTFCDCRMGVAVEGDYKRQARAAEVA